MKNLKNYFLSAMALCLSIGFLTLTSCKDDEKDPEPVVETFDNPTILVSPSTASQNPGKSVTLTIAVTADAGLSSVKVGDTEIKSYTTTTKADAFTYVYDVAADAANGDVTLTFTVTDVQETAVTASATATITVTIEPVDCKETIAANITGDVTWTKSCTYTLIGNIYVESGAKLTIEAGTVIYGDKASKGALIVSRGAEIVAVGTAAEPIVFTSSAPAGFRNYGDWGGVVILGKSANNQSADKTIEGISAASGDNGLYGGTADDDNSGKFVYARIEFAGIALSTDNELNGLTLGSVGSETEIHHIQVSYSGDDSYEWFGGTVNMHHIIAYRGWDDDFDTDFGFRGNVQYAVSYRDPNIADKSGSNGFESDNDGSGSTNTPKTSATFANVTWFGPYVYAGLSGSAASSNFQYGGHIRRNTDLQVLNSVFIGSKLEGVHFDKTGSAAAFKGNYMARIGVSVSKAVKKVTTGNGYDDSTFDADNFIETDQATLDLSAKFAGLTASLDINAPTALLATGSSLLTGGKTVPTGLTQETYIGAFDATTDWTAGWSNWTPNTTEY